MKPKSHLPDDARIRAEMNKLVSATISALEQADLMEELRLLQTRVFSHHSTRLFDVLDNPEAQTVEFKPFLELLLRHVGEVARDDKRSLDDRRNEIRRSIEFAGF